MEQLEAPSEHRDTWDMFSEGQKQLPSLVKAGMSHMAPRRALIRRVLQLRLGPVAIKELCLLPSKTQFFFCFFLAELQQQEHKETTHQRLRSDRERIKLFLPWPGWIYSSGIGVEVFKDKYRLLLLLPWKQATGSDREPFGVWRIQNSVNLRLFA